MRSFEPASLDALLRIPLERLQSAAADAMGANEVRLTPRGFAPRGCQEPGFYLTGDSLSTQGDAVDLAVLLFMCGQYLPNAQLCAVAADGRLIHARGYTWCGFFDFAGDFGALCASGETDDPGDYVVTPTTRFRIASVSKVITAIATLQLIEGRTTAAGFVNIPGLGTRAHRYLDFTSSYNGTPPDPRLLDITIVALLTHQAGFGTGFDGFRDENIASSLGHPLPVDTADHLRYANAFLLNYDPAAAWSPFAGGTCSYSNYGYRLLGSAIATASGQPYVDFVHDQVFAPVGALLSLPVVTGRRLWDEAPLYYTDLPLHDDADACVGCSDSYKASVLRSRVDGASVLADRPCVYAPYGARNLNDGGEAHGGWLSTGVDLMLVFRELLPARRGSSRLLSPSSLELMFTPFVVQGTIRSGCANAGATVYQGAAWDLNAYGYAGANGKSGSVEGCRTYAMIWHPLEPALARPQVEAPAGSTQVGPDLATPASLAVRGPPEAGAAVLFVNRYDFLPGPVAAHEVFREWLVAVGIPGLCGAAREVGDLFPDYAPEAA